MEIEPQDKNIQLRKRSEEAKDEREYPLDFEMKALPPKTIKLSRKMRYLCFWVIVLASIIVNMDHGTIPAATKEIEDDFNIKITGLGIFGSAVYFGNGLGSIILAWIISYTNRKWLLALSLIIQAGMLLAFTLNNNLIFLTINRLIVGLAQNTYGVYTPVWIDQFGIKSKKTIMMALFQISSPLGLILGYLLTLAVKTTFNWKVSYIIQTVLNLGVFIGIIIFPSVLFSKEYHPIKVNQNLPLNENTSGDSTGMNTLERQGNRDINADDDSSVFGEETDRNDHYCGSICSLFKEPVFIFCVLTVTCLLFISTAITFWGTDYFEYIMKFPKQQVFTAFLIICVTGPILGVILGGIFVQKMGGYEQKHSIMYCLIMICVGAFLTVPVYWLDSIVSITAMIWMVLFFGGSTIPIIIGILISSLPPNLRAAGNSVSNVINYFVGWFPAPFFYSLIYQSTKDTTPKLAMALTLGYSFFGLIFLTIASYFRYKRFGDPASQENLNLKTYNEPDNTRDSNASIDEENKSTSPIN